MPRVWLEAVAIVGGAFLIAFIWMAAAGAGKPLVPVAIATRAPTTVALAPTAAPTAAPPTVAPTTAPIAAATSQPVVAPAPAAQPKPAPGVAARAPAGPSAETQAYLDWLGPETQLAGQSLQAIGLQSQLVGQNPRLLADNDWRIKTAVAVAVMQTTGQEMQSYPKPVPREAQKLDVLVKDLGGDLVYIATEYTAGIDQNSVQHIGNATTRMNGVAPKSQAAAVEIRALRGQ